MRSALLRGLLPFNPGYLFLLLRYRISFHFVDFFSILEFSKTIHVLCRVHWSIMMLKTVTTMKRRVVRNHENMQPLLAMMVPLPLMILLSVVQAAKAVTNRQRSGADLATNRRVSLQDPINLPFAGSKQIIIGVNAALLSLISGELVLHGTNDSEFRSSGLRRQLCDQTEL